MFPLPLLQRNRSSNKLQSKPYLLFDAGGTIVFPDQSFLIRQARRQGLTLTHLQLFEGYYELIHSLNLEYKTHKSPKPWPEGYAYALFKTLGISSPATDAVADAFNTQHDRRNLWAFTFSQVKEALSNLAKQGYRMSVISNSDGRTETVLRDLNLDRYFEHIFDSELLGVEKPDPAIFKAALKRLKLKPANVFYIGDIFYADVRGANLAGLGGIHLDPLGFYAGQPGVHLTNVNRLPAWLTQYADNPSAFNLFPTKSSHDAPRPMSNTSQRNPSLFGNLRTYAVRYRSGFVTRVKDEFTAIFNPSQGSVTPSKRPTAYS